MSKLYVDAVEPEGVSTVLTLGSATDTIQIPGGGAGASKVLTSDATGGATWEASASATNTPSFGAYLAANQSYSNDTWTKITMNTEEWDTDSAYDHTTNYRFTVPAAKAGKYVFSVSTIFDDTGGGQAVRHGWLAIYKIPSGGSAAAFKQIKQDSDGSRSTLLGQNLTAVIDLAVGDAIEFWALVSQNAYDGVTIGGQENTFCSGYKLL
tara:strand:+ start:78 stop:704 length:627 start_codon:yes stop_codon:yes gene_type:complete